MKIIEQLVTIFFTIIGELVKLLFEGATLILKSSSKKQEKYNADFLPARKVLSRRHKGFYLGNRNLSIHDSTINAVITGGTGVGKTSSVLIPTAFTADASLILNDPSGELFLKTSGFLERKGYDIRVLNFASPDKSDGYNPLSRAQSSSEIQKVAHTLIENTLGGNGKDMFWNTQAVSLLSVLIGIIKEQKPEFQHLTGVRHLLSGMTANPESVDSLFAQTNNEQLYNDYKTFVGYEDKLFTNIAATTQAALSMFQDNDVARITSFDTINFEDFREQKTALYIQTKISDQKYYAPIVALFFEQFFGFIMSRLAQKGDLPIFCLIDEAASLKLPTLPIAMANVRKHNAGIMLLIQSHSQLVHNYGRYETESIFANSFAKMYFTNQDLETVRALEQMLGKHEFEDDDGKRRVMPLMTADSIRTMDKDRALLLCGHHKPIRVSLRPYYKHFGMRACSEIKPSKLFSKLPFNDIPLIPLSPQRDNG